MLPAPLDYRRVDAFCTEFLTVPKGTGAGGAFRLRPWQRRIVREFFPAREAGTRVGIALSSTLAGMALGGWMSGAIFDATGSYQAAVLNGLLWNGANMAVAAWLLLRARRRPRVALA